MGVGFLGDAETGVKVCVCVERLLEVISERIVYPHLSSAALPHPFEVFTPLG